MKLDSARELKQRLMSEVVAPFSQSASRVRTVGSRAVELANERSGVADGETIFGVGARSFDTLPRVQRSIALGVSGEKKEYRLAVRVQRPSLLHSPLVEHLRSQAKGEVDVRVVGHVDKRTERRRTTPRRALPARRTVAVPWYQKDTRPLLIGASIAHVDVTAGTIGAFVERQGVPYVLSNNHVLANEDNAAKGDWVLQRAPYDGGGSPAERAGQLQHWVRLKPMGANLVDAALADIRSGLTFDGARLRELVGGADRKLRGPGPEFVDEGEVVYKVGRTTGPTKGRVTAFGLDNLVVRYDVGNLRLDDQIEIEGFEDRAFSDGGDSGSLILNSDMFAIGLLFAGGDSGGANGLGLTYANPIHRVLADLSATLLY